MTGAASGHADLRRARPELRLVFVPFIALAAAAAIVLCIFTTQTDLLFAWTIRSPLTAAMIGAGYAGALVLFIASVREPAWANVRVAVLAPFVLSSLMLIATLRYLGAFHFAAGPIPAFVAWLWLVVYIVVPPALAYVWIRQVREPGRDPPRMHPLPAPLRVVAALMALGLAAPAVSLFLAPGWMEPLWPWALTPLTAASIGAWMLGIAAGFVLATLEGDFGRMRTGTAGLLAIGVMGLVAIARFPDEVRWQSAGAYVLLVVLAIFVAFGVLGQVLGRRPAIERPRARALP